MSPRRSAPTPLIVAALIFAGCDATANITSPERETTSITRPEPDTVSVDLTGVVRSTEDGSPVAGARVLVCSESTTFGFRWCSDPTDVGDDGGFQLIASVPTGVCPIYARAAHPEFVAGKSPVACGGSKQERAFHLEPLASLDITLELDSVQLGVGVEHRLTATVRGRNGRTIEAVTPDWLTSDSSVAAVDGGRVVGVDVGEAVVSATLGGTPASTRIVVKRPPEELAGAMAYVTHDGYAGQSARVTRIHVESGAAVHPPLDVPDVGPMVAAPDGSAMYTASGNVLTVRQSRTLARIADIDIGRPINGLATGPDGSRIYALSTLDRGLTVVDAVSRTVLGTFEVPTVPLKIWISPDGARALVVGYDAANHGRIHELDLVTGLWVSDFIDLGDGRASELALSPDGTRLVAVRYGRGDAVLVDVAEGRIVADSIPVGLRPTDVVIHPDGSRAWVTSIVRNTVAEIDLTNGAVRNRIPVGPVPWSMALTTDGRFAYVTSQGTSTVTVIDTHAATVVGPPIALPDRPGSIVIHP